MMKYWSVPHGRSRSGGVGITGRGLSGLAAWLLAGCLGVMPGLTRAGDETLRLRHGGIGRQVLVHVPDRPAKGLPVVLVLHGAGGNPERMAEWTGMNETADHHGFIVAYPRGVGIVSTWNAGTCCGPAERRGVDDVGFLRQAVETIAQRWAVDRKRIYVAGMSNGGMMAYRLAAEAPDMVAAAAVVEGTMTLDALPAGQPVPILHIHSLDDPRVPFAGGNRGRMRFPPVEQALAAWRRRDGCPQAPMASKAKPLTWRPPGGGALHEASLVRYGPCRNGTEVTLWLLKGPGHVWTGARGKEPIPAFLGAKSDVLDANEVVWDFFARYRLGGLASAGGAPAAVTGSAKDASGKSAGDSSEVGRPGNTR